MSRSYTEDWERKKSYLIRSLFHDIPFRALSPVPECLEETHDGSTHSSDTELPQESTSSLEVYSESEATISDAPLDPVPPSSGVHTTLLTRPYSPLPPLIIERMPNRHDEPPEYYRTLLAKIRLIYRKIFIEGKNFSDVDFLDSFDSGNERQTIDNEDIEMAGSLSELSEENRSFSSDGYSADTETSDNEESNGSNLESIEVVNDYKRQTAGSLDIIALQSNTIEENANNSNNKISDLNIEEIARESFVSEEEADYRQITTQAEVHIDGAQLAVIRPSPVYEEPRIQVIPMVVSDAVTLTRSPEEQLRDNLNTKFKEPSLETQLVFDATQMSPSTQVTETLVNEEVSPEPVASLACEDPQANAVQYLMETAPLEAPRSTSEDMAISPILPFARRYRSPDVRGSQATTEVSEDQDANYRHAIESEIHRYSSPDAQVSKETQKQAFVLRFSKTTEHSFVQEKKDTDVAAQETTPSTEESGNLTNDHIEVIRTRQLDASVESIPIDTTRLSSDMDLTCERVGNTPRDISNVTSTSQDGCHNTTADPKTSCDITDVLALIINDSPQEKLEDISRESSARKRSYGDISAQTEAFRWNDLRANLFVGTAKIFRLC